MLAISKVRATKLSMYAGPDRFSEVITRLDYGDEGRVFQYGKDWVLIRCRGQFGYVQAEYVSIILSEVDPEIDPETLNKQSEATESPAAGTAQPSAEQ